MSTYYARPRRSIVAGLFGVALFASAALSCGQSSILAQEPSAAEKEYLAMQRQLYDSIRWQTGPCIAKVGSNAQISVPDGYQFTGPAGARAWAELTQNPPDDRTLGVLMPVEGRDWFMIFEFDESGYVKDDDKDKLDADAILASIQEGTKESNEDRVRNGWGTLTITGWEQAPHYNPQTHNLEWAIKGHAEGEPLLNYNTRILGRRGVMSVALVVNPAEIATILPESKKVLGGFEYVSGERYAEWQAGDKIAEYGLAGLVAGGAAAVLIKSGFLTKFLKPIIVGVAVVFGWLGKVLFGRRAQA
jgi:uncharacterized membrane-anchored protein